MLWDAIDEHHNNMYLYFNIHTSINTAVKRSLAEN